MKPHNAAPSDLPCAYCFILGHHINCVVHMAMQTDCELYLQMSSKY